MILWTTKNPNTIDRAFWKLVAVCVLIAVVAVGLLTLTARNDNRMDSQLDTVEAR